MWCLKANGKPCSTLFQLHAQLYMMTNDELDMVLIGSLMTTVHNQEDTTVRSRHKSHLALCIMVTMSPRQLLGFFMELERVN